MGRVVVRALRVVGSEGLEGGRERGPVAVRNDGSKLPTRGGGGSGWHEHIERTHQA